MNSATDTLALQNLTKIFKIKTGAFRHADLKAVDEVNISIAPGRTLAVVGESGSGKTTLARLILRLIEPTGGTVLLENTDITALQGTALEARRGRMQIVFQDPYDSLSPWQTVGRTVAEPLILHQNLSMQQASEPVARMLERVGLSPEHAKRYPHELSGGQAQRVGIARSMITNPALVVLDEPTSSLDMSVQSQILLLLQSLQEEMNISYLFISHDLTVVRYIAHDLAVMYLGKVVESGPASQVFASPRHPYTEALLKAAPRPDPSYKTDHVYLVGEQPTALDRAAGCPLYGRCPIAEDVCADTPQQLVEIEARHRVACWKRT
ncbi:MAG: ATP-binding cassette domain-containing protein [bacterium]|nr:ATP-binding cassette domain-containing protein [Acidimicrobiia bacterium]MCY4648905.1 ATP-binding cassette domain-containing protein [bacterium]